MRTGTETQWEADDHAATESRKLQSPRYAATRASLLLLPAASRGTASTLTPVHAAYAATAPWGNISWISDKSLADMKAIHERRRFVMHEEMTPMGEQLSSRQPVTYDTCDHVEGPFYHGTKSALDAGTELVPGYGSNFQQSRVSNNIYFTTLVETAAWGAELATALAASGDRGHIYVVEPQGPFEDDPNVTDKRFPGNPTQSYRTRHPLRIVAELESWQGHTPETLRSMLDHLALLREQGRDVIED